MKIIGYKIRVCARIFGAEETKDWEGCEVAPGLAVGKAYLKAGKWAITHLSSGKAIWHWFGSRHEALEAGARLAPLADWTRPEEEITEEIRKRAWEVLTC